MPVTPAETGFDWGSGADWVSAVANIVLAIAACVAAGAWKKQSRGQRKLAVAEETMVQFYEMRALFDEIRPERRRLEQILAGDRRRDEMEGIRKRIEAASDQVSTFYARRFVAMANLGKEIEADFEAVFLLYRQVRLAARMLSLELDGDHIGRYGNKVFREERGDVEDAVDSIISRVEAKFAAEVNTELALPKGLLEKIARVAVDLIR